MRVEGPTDDSVIEAGAGAGAVDPEHFDVVVIGAGLSGIGAAHHLQSDCPWATYTILEARGSIGGTWDLFRYPGVRSDSDMFTLGYGFRPWAGEKSISDGASILEYIRATAREAGIDGNIRFGHKVFSAEWSSEESRWAITAHRDDGSKVTLSANFVVSCTGYYRYDRGYLPDFAGMDTYEGKLVHPQQWPENLDYAGKRVIVIGSGATAMTLVPSMASLAGHVTMLQRSPTYVMSLDAENRVVNRVRRMLPSKLAGPVARWALAMGTLGFYRLSRSRPRLVKRMIRRQLERQLPPGFDIDTHFSPDYDPWDQRLCIVADGDLFREIHRGAVDIVTDHIREFTPKGVLVGSGDELQADIIVAATGLELLFLGGVELSVDGESVDPSERLTYKGMMIEGVPNLAVVIGYTNASWTLKADLTSDYVCRLLNHMRHRGQDLCVAKNDAGEVERRPLLGLTSGYVQRSADLMPKQGTKFPWQVHQSYLKDYRAMKMSPIEDDAMVFARRGRRVQTPHRGPRESTIHDG